MQAGVFVTDTSARKVHEQYYKIAFSISGLIDIIVKGCGQQWNILSSDIVRFRFYNLVYKGFMVKLLRADGGCLGTRRR